MEDKAYIAARNRLIPVAEKVAHKTAGEKPKKQGKAMDTWTLIWNKTFHSTMDTLAKQAGLIQ